MIEEWLPNSTNTHCKGANIVLHNQKLWDQNVVPFLDMTVWGWLWCTPAVPLTPALPRAPQRVHSLGRRCLPTGLMRTRLCADQGENNMHNIMGNSAQGVGYGCQMADLVRTWRGAWSQTAGTTRALAPFGVVTLAAGGDEGGKDMGGMRSSQTANYGASRVLYEYQ